MMKRLLLAGAVCFLAASEVVAQQGTVIYEERVRLDFDLPPHMQIMRDRIPTENVSQRRLLFDGPVAIMTSVPAEEEQLELSDRRFGFWFWWGGQDDNTETFVDREANRVVQRVEFFGRTFLVTDSLQRKPWRLTGERAEFLGYMTLQAVAKTSDTTSVEAWFAPQIPVPVGPAGYGDLPGLILMLSEDGGSRSFVAQEVRIDELEASLLRAPAQGRTVGRQEFASLVEDRMRELGFPRELRARFRPRL